METRGRTRAAGISGGSSRLGTLLIVAFAAALALASIGVVPAQAEDHDDSTDVTFELQGDAALYVDAPANADLGVLVEDAGLLIGGGEFTSEAFGEVTVVDTRTGVPSSWTATATSEGFVHTDVLDAGGDFGSAPDHQRIPASSVTYDPHTVVASVGLSGDVSTFESGTLADDGDDPAVGTTSLLGGSQVTWEPTLTFDLTGEESLGEYQGTITHSVS